MGSCCINAQHQPSNQKRNRNQVQNNRNTFDKRSVSHRLSTQNDQKFTAFLFGQKFQKLLQQFTAQKQQNRQSWITSHQSVLKQIQVEALKYQEDLENSKSKLRIQLDSDIKKIQDQFNKYAKSVKQGAEHENEKLEFLVLKLEIQDANVSNEIQDLAINIVQVEANLKQKQSKRHQCNFSRSELVNSSKDPLYLQVLLKNKEFLKFKSSQVPCVCTIYMGQILQNKKFFNEKFTLFKKNDKSAKTGQQLQYQPTLPPKQSKGVMAVRLQVISQRSVEELKMQIKGIIQQLQFCMQGQMGWNHLNSLRSSFASSQNDPSFVSMFGRQESDLRQLNIQ